MSTDDIIKGWKGEEDETRQAAGAPEHPAGEIDLSDEDLESVSGGDDGTTLDCTANPSWCKGTCCFPPFNLGCCEDAIAE